VTRRAAAVLAAALGVSAIAWLAAAEGKPTWEVVVPATVELVAGEPGQLVIDLVANDGRTISRDGPVRVDLAPDDGVVAARRRLALIDAADPSAPAPRFAVKLTAATAGTYEVEVAVRLWLCSRRACKPVRDKRTVTVEVTAAAPVPDAAPAPPDAAPPVDARKKKPRATSR
jgi:hypothetical protein